MSAIPIPVFNPEIEERTNPLSIAFSTSIPRSLSFSSGQRARESDDLLRQLTGLLARAGRAAFLEQIRADPRTSIDASGNLVPVPGSDIRETAAFPVNASAQVPILAGSRLDPYGFIRPDVGRVFLSEGLRA